ncbi:Rid family hydrolase [Erythrobacter sp. WG]|uniref:Rid family hydrolase n=1 Tax=Erythrobacter sp. WG TaxID=2985510 RepID=UPI002270FB02|nr:Rid family hydrolase [Erythrobacter sp. WG]MCX9147288.1 Rid family hydrolase [Erythrobacter sp. WG]
MHQKHFASVAAAFALALSAAAAHAGEPKQTLMPEHPEARAFQEFAGFSDAVIHGDTIHLSGVVAGPVPGETDLTPGYERAFARIDGILKRLGATWDDVLVFDTFHAGKTSAQLDDLVTVKNRYIKAPFPAWTAVGVTELYEPTAVTEIKLTVRKP